jgi:hypothetical protein
MNDPVSEFIKGVGWTPCFDNSKIVAFNDGRRFRLTLRKPEPGERVMQISQYHPLFTRSNKVDMLRVVEWFKEKLPWFIHFYRVPRGGYRFSHHTVVVEVL